MDGRLNTLQAHFAIFMIFAASAYSNHHHAFLHYVWAPARARISKQVLVLREHSHKSNERKVPFMYQTALASILSVLLDQTLQR
jgi:hypothetical protein